MIDVNFMMVSVIGRMFPQYIMKVREKANIRNQYNEVQHLTQDPIWESDKSTRKAHEASHTFKSQETSPFPTCDRKAAMN